jgi:hypothetical protein
MIGDAKSAKIKPKNRPDTFAMLTLLEHNAAKIGITAAGLLVVVYSIGIMLNGDMSPATRQERWGKLKNVFICAVIIAGVGAFIQLALSFGGML